MASLASQNISDSYTQLLKFTSSGGVAGTLGSTEDGAGKVTALSLSSTEIKTTGSLTVAGTSSFTGNVTFGTSFTASNGTATIGTLSVGTQSIGTSTVNLSTISTATISTATISTSTISTATIPTILGAVTFGSSITASTGTATIGTESVNVSTVSSATFGTARITGSTGGLSGINYTTSTFTGSTLAGNTVSTGTFALAGAALTDIVIGSLNSLGSATAGGSQAFSFTIFPKASSVVQYNINNASNTTGTIPAGTIYATALKFTA